MRKLLALINRDTNGIVNTAEYNPFQQGDQERATKLLNRYRDDWYQNTSLFNDIALDIREFYR